MSNVRFTRRAREDLLNIWVYIANQNPLAADRVYDRIEETCRLLEDHPRLGPARPEIAEDARSLVVDRWIAFYRVMEDGVQIVRIVDGARDLTSLEWAPK
ncbi:type II toxin-antitoxin system RelE/ParE family toxin [Labrys monachus]|uniref:Toxin ParE1/3/4 n=1 Tax=Labrys monachus TaxID=217067 RepID=A0ABU0FPD2_9HYPH|nr:type II toxin-antitoxin system RelE/ParE family toxin [Labrys monachus]MDQ0396470.1 toxin ParE1/3/4 [Labrys monachus]